MTTPSPEQPDMTARKRRLKPDERRSQIIDAAVAFFAEVGLDGRTRDLSARAGITQSLLYNYFGSKEALIEAVFERVYLDRLDLEWRALLLDRSTTLSTRLRRFYQAYTRVIFSYEWMRIFMFAGLAGAKLNTRYLGHLSATFLEPLLAEVRAASAPGSRAPEMADIWALHGSIVYLGIRRYVYQVPIEEEDQVVIARAVGRFLMDFGISAT